MTLFVVFGGRQNISRRPKGAGALIRRMVLVVDVVAVPIIRRFGFRQEPVQHDLVV